jgi:hypothetical protein
MESHYADSATKALPAKYGREPDRSLRELRSMREELPRICEKHENRGGKTPAAKLQPSLPAAAQKIGPFREIPLTCEAND